MTSTIKVNKIQNQCGQNIINENSNTITIGASGDTIALASGASQTGFGRSGSVNWQTSIKTTAFTAASGEGYFCDTATTGAFEVTLPSSPSVGDIVALKDYALSFDTANLTINRNSSPINGSNSVNPVLSTEGQSVVLVYADSTKGWIPTQDDSSTIQGVNPAYMAATGGTTSDDGDFRVHTFTGPGTFTVTAIGNSLGSDSISYTVIGGGGAGGTGPTGGGGGAGGYREGKGAPDNYCATPLAAPGHSIPSVPVAFPITIGAGGSAGSGGPEAFNSSNGNSGSPSTGLGFVGAGGGKGTGQPANSGSTGPGAAGGSGGGNNPSFPNAAYAGNTPPVSPPQGNPGGNSHPGSPTPAEVGGGGGAISTSQPTGVWTGGCGAETNISGSSVGRAGGGGGGSSTAGGLPYPAGVAPQGGGLAVDGGGNGARSSSPGTPSIPGVSGTANTGGGGGGGGRQGSVVNYAGGAGGSGVVIMRYKFQN